MDIKTLKVEFREMSEDVINELCKFGRFVRNVNV